MNQAPSYTLTPVPPQTFGTMNISQGERLNLGNGSFLQLVEVADARSQAHHYTVGLTYGLLSARPELAFLTPTRPGLAKP